MQTQEKRLHSGMVKRILREAARRETQRENADFNQDLLDSLQDLTGATSAELALITRKVTGEANLFSAIRRQILVAGGILLLFPVLPLIWLLY